MNEGQNRGRRFASHDNVTFLSDAFHRWTYLSSYILNFSLNFFPRSIFFCLSILFLSLPNFHSSVYFLLFPLSPISLFLFYFSFFFHLSLLFNVFYHLFLPFLFSVVLPCFSQIFFTFLSSFAPLVFLSPEPLRPVKVVFFWWQDYLKPLSLENQS